MYNINSFVVILAEKFLKFENSEIVNEEIKIYIGTIGKKFSLLIINVAVAS